MSRMIEGLTGFKNFMNPQSNTWMENADETDEEELKEFCEFMEEECNAEFIEEINQESINTMIDYSAFPSVSNSVSKGSATLLSSFEKRKVKKKRKQKVTPLKNLKSIIVENPRLVSPTKSTPPSSPFHPQSCTFEYIPHDVVGEYESIDITPSNYPSNLTHVSSCQIKQTSRIFLFGSSVTNRNVSTHLISFTVEPSSHPNTNLKKQHLEKFPKDVLPSFGSDSRIMMVVNTYLESYYLFIYSKDTFFNTQVDSNGNLLSPFRKCEFTKTNEATEFFTMISKYKDSEIWRFGGRNKKTLELTNELEVFSTIDKKHIKIEKIIPKSSKIPAPRQDHCMYYDSKKERIFIFGGVDKNGNLLNDLQCFDMENKTWREIKTNFNLPPLKNCRLTMDGYKLNRRLQLIGGNFSDGSVNSLIISINPETGDVKVHSTLEGLPYTLDVSVSNTSDMISFGNDSVVKILGEGKKTEVDSWISQILIEKSGHDVTFQLKSGNQITAHRSFLASRSKFFEKLFETHQNTYPLEGLQDDTLQFYINFLYTGYPQISILPKPIDSKLIQILQVDQNNSLRNYITGEAIYITDIYHITRSVEDDIRKLYNLAIQSKNQSKKATNNSSLICIQLLEENTKTDYFFVDKTFMRRIDFFRNILDSGMSEAETGVITLEISSECCEKLIEFMYSGQISNISDNALLELFIISKQYLHCQELVHYCENNLSRIIQNLTPQVAVHIIDYFRDICHAVDDLISRCRYYICTNFDNSREDILNLDSDSRYELSRLYFDYLKRKFKRK